MFNPIFFSINFFFYLYIMRDADASNIYLVPQIKDRNYVDNYKE